MRTVGIILILAGVAALTFGSITYTRREKVVDIGPVEASVTDRERIPIPPIAGALALVAGIVIVARGRSTAA
jgi:uncharacterized membrane protein HdeD (DUF308 family)